MMPAWSARRARILTILSRSLLKTSTIEADPPINVVPTRMADMLAGLE